ncbi:MAG: hypothetical protein B0D92_00785 [Spirochaeta sp. LUC14_002_19_P3]|nr:MAG: hypothetical protein B0D92_00785 [Spirochaeta sp. LUC14_002_19_P3]
MNKKTIFSVGLTLVLLTAVFIFPAAASENSKSIPEGHYADGIYTGTGLGFRPSIKVEVEIKDGKAVRIEIISHKEVGPRYWMRAISLIPKAIIKEQSTKVDAVGGSTYTSRGIMEAVEDALSRAEKL